MERASRFMTQDEFQKDRKNTSVKYKFIYYTCMCWESHFIIQKFASKLIAENALLNINITTNEV